MGTRTTNGRADTASTAADAMRRRLVARSGLTDRRVRLAGIDTAIVEGGEGRPMVLLHGPGEYWGVWLPAIERLRDDFRVLAVDLPGHGASGLPEGRLDRARVLAWLDAIVTTVDGPPIVAGHLVGGAIAARYAVTHSERLAHLLLVDTMGLGWYRPSPRFALPMVHFMARPNAQTRDRFFEECFVDFDRTGANFGDRWDDLRDYALAQSRQSDNQRALRALMPRFAVPPIPRHELAAISVPTTLVHGRHDLQVPLRLAIAASEQLGWPLHVIEDARDDPGAEQPDALVAVFRAALKATVRS